MHTDIIIIIIIIRITCVLERYTNNVRIYLEQICYFIYYYNEFFFSSFSLTPSYVLLFRIKNLYFFSLFKLQLQLQFITIGIL